MAILDFAGSSALQAVSECPRCRLASNSSIIFKFMTTLHVLVFLKTLLNVLKGFYFNIQNIDKVSQQYHGRNQLVICNLSKVLDNFFFNPIPTGRGTKTIL